MTLEDLRGRLSQFAREREWTPFHTPKNLAMAVAGEAGELVALFQWMRPEESEVEMLAPESLQKVRSEIADVFLYLLQLADRLELDLLEASAAKLVENSEKYPISKSKGNSTKYTDFR